MTPIKLTAKEVKAAERELYTRSFYEFVKAAWRHIDTAPFKDNWHIGVLCDHLEAVANGKIQRLLINIAPGSGKSLIINVMFPAWLWTHSPDKRIISTSHKEKLAIRDSTKTRRLIESDWYQGFWPIGLRADQNSKAGFENTSFGAREASPFSSITGTRGNFVIVDDPHSVDEAKSDSYRKAAVDTFRETIPSRVNDPANDAIIVVMQRLHMEDVSGFILENPDLGYDHLCIPYIADGVDRPATKIGWKDTREEGEFMFPQHFPETFVKQQKASLGPYGFSGQYQQDPVPAGDGFFQTEWFHRYKPSQLPANLHYYMTSDHAPGGTGDWNVFRIWGVDAQRNLWLVDSFRKKCRMDEAFGVERDKSGRTVLRSEGALPLIRKWSPLCWYPENDNTWVANKSFLEAFMLDTQTFCAIKPLATKGSGDKVGKATAYQAMASAGLVHLPEGPVGDEALLEYSRFPAGKHDDQVDADGAIARAISMTALIIEEEETKKEYGDDWDDKSLDSSLANYWG